MNFTREIIWLFHFTPWVQGEEENSRAANEPGNVTQESLAKNRRQGGELNRENEYFHSHVKKRMVISEHASKVIFHSQNLTSINKFH